MKQIIQKLKQIKKYCTEHNYYCQNCVYNNGGECRMQRAMSLLVLVPDDWDLERFEEILDEVDC